MSSTTYAATTRKQDQRLVTKDSLYEMMRTVEQQLHGIARNTGFREKDYEDLLQQTACRLLERMENGYEIRRRTAKSFIKQVFANLCVDEVRKREGRGRKLKIIYEHACKQPLEKRVLASEDTPLDNIIREEEKHQIHTQVNALRPVERYACVLRYFYEGDMRGIAVRLGKDESYVRKILSLARRKLRERLADQEDKNQIFL